MHDIDRLSAPEKSGIRSAVHSILREFAMGGNHGPILMQELFLRTADELIRTRVIDKPQHLGGKSAGGKKFITYKGKQQSKLFPNYDISNNIADLVRQTFWEFFTRGILAPATAINWGVKEHDPLPLDKPAPLDYWVSFEWVMLTPFGVNVFTDTQDRVQVHDPDGYLQNFWGAVPSPDAEMMRYLSEGIAVFRNGHLLASVVLLGVASERLIEVLAENLRDALRKIGQGDTWFRDKYEKKRASLDRFKAISDKLTGQFNQELKDNDLLDPFNNVVTLVFQQLRCSRNDIAHPNERALTWNEASGFFHHFVQYFKYINKIIVLLSQVK